MATLVDKYFSHADFDMIEAAVKKAELTSDGEIAVQLASTSRLWQVERQLYALGFAVLCALVTLYFTRDVNWGVYYNTTQALLWSAVGFVGAYFSWKYVLGGNTRMRRVVWNKALGIFERLTPTRGHTGVLVYVSLEEEQAAIIADKAIAAKLAPEYWHTPHAMIIDAIKAGRHAEGIVQAIESIGAELARHFPRTGDDTNELSDKPTITP